METDDFRPRPDQLLERSQQRALRAESPRPRPDDCGRAVLVMHDIDELPISDIATQLSMRRFTGYSRLRKARKEFAAALSSLDKAHES